MRHVTGRGSSEGCQYVSSGVYYRQLTRVQSLTCHEFAFRPIKIIAQNGEAVMCKVQPDLSIKSFRATDFGASFGEYYLIEERWWS